MGQYLSKTGLTKLWERCSAVFARANSVISVFKFNNTTLTVTNQTVDLQIPDASSSAKGLMTTTQVSALANKADKATTLAGYGITDAMTATDIQSAISNAVAANMDVNISIADSAPSTAPPNPSTTIYIVLVSNGGSVSKQLYTEYIWVNSTEAWEQLGAQTMDLSNYWNTSNLTEITDSEITTICV